MSRILASVDRNLLLRSGQESGSNLEVPEDAFHDVDIIDVLMMRGVAPQLHSMSEEKRERSVLTLLADAANKVGF